MDRFKNIVVLFAIVAISAIFIFSCKKKEDEAELPRNVDFYIRYQSEGNQFNSLCKLSYADSLAAGQPDTASYDITIGGKDMKEIIPPSGAKHYNFKTNMPYAPDYEIKIKSRAGSIISQSTKLGKIDSVKVSNTISKSKGISYSYAGTPLTANESIITMIVTKDGKSASNTIQGPTTTNEMTFKSQDLGLLNDGEVEIYLIRTNTEDVVNNNMNFFIRNEYFSKTYKINLVK